MQRADYQRRLAEAAAIVEEVGLAAGLTRGWAGCLGSRGRPARSVGSGVFEPLQLLPPFAALLAYAPRARTLAARAARSRRCAWPPSGSA